ncbi:FenI protein, partial [Candidatus Arthromitus sp. SFB-1]
SYISEGKDFLKYAINETRKRGIEFHAWFNPYRVTKDPLINNTKEEILETLHKNNFARLNKDLVYLFQGKLFLDPGRYEVIEFVKNTIHEFITKYDVDGIHFDDYFYPYGSQNIKGVNYKFGDMNEDLKNIQ